jgi:hypothetical protein
MNTPLPQPVTGAEMMALHPSVSVIDDKENGAFDLLIPGGGTYSIQHSRIDTPEKLIGWIHQLAEKQWVTMDHIYELIEAARERGVEPDFSA